MQGEGITSRLGIAVEPTYDKYVDKDNMGVEFRFEDGGVMRLRPHFCEGENKQIRELHNDVGLIEIEMVWPTPWGYTGGTDLVSIDRAQAMAEGFEFVGKFVNLGLEIKDNL